MIAIGKKPMDSNFKGTEMCNMIHLNDDAYPDAQDGDTVKTEVSGKYIIHDGQKFLMAHEADGLPVKDIHDSMQEDESPEEDSSDDEESPEESESNTNDFQSSFDSFANKSKKRQGME